PACLIADQFFANVHVSHHHVVVRRFRPDRLPQEVGRNAIGLSLDLVGHAERASSYSPEIVGCANGSQRENGHEGQCEAAHEDTPPGALSTKHPNQKHNYCWKAEYETVIGTIVCQK